MTATDDRSPHSWFSRISSIFATFALAINHDFCPGANRYLYWLKQPLLVLLLATVVALVIGTSVAFQGYVVASGLVAVIVLGTLWPFVGMVGLSATLRFERRRVREGEPVTAILSVRNPMPWSAWGLVLERGFTRDEESTAGVVNDRGGRDIGLALARVPGFSRSEFRWDFKPECRGEYPFQLPCLTTSFPFGLWHRSRDVQVASHVLVWPRTIELNELLLPQGQSYSLGALSQYRAGYEGDVIGTRQYREGDLLRHVHWAQTARYGKLIVAERQANLTSTVRVRVDLDPQSHTLGANGSFEMALRVLSSVCSALSRYNTRVVVELGEQVHLIESGAVGQQRFNDELARLQLAPLNGTRIADRTWRFTAELQLVIATARSASHFFGGEASRRRIILLDWDDAAIEQRHAVRTPQVWIRLKPTADVLEQLKLQWCVAHESEWSHA
jgi:uncharacterized protein (DUF58 family)